MLLIINVEHSYAAQYFILHLSEILIFCNIINIFTVTFDQFNASSINKSILLQTCEW